MLKKNRKASHVGMIISFVVFVTFIIFLYSIVRPAINTGQDKKTMADYLVTQLIANISNNFTSTSVEISSEKNPQQECAMLQAFLVLSEIPPVVIVQDKSKTEQDAFTNRAGDLGIYRTSGGNLFFRIFSSPEFPALTNKEKPPECEYVLDDDYSVGIIKKDVLPFKKNLDYLLNYYNENYEQIKISLNVPPGTEFGFGFTQSDGTRTDAGNPPSSVDIYSAEIPIQYVDENVEILSGFINIKVW